MKFARLDMLFLIWSLPVFILVFIYGWKKRRKILSGYAQSKSLGTIVPGNLSVRRRLKASLILCVLFFIAIALSGPQYGYKWQEIERKGIDIIVALDCSKSMLATDINPTRLDRAKREVYDLLTLLQGDRIGLVAFAGTAFLQAPLTLDYTGFHIFLTALSPDFLPVGGTDIPAAISTSLSAFDPKTNSEKAVILITDGENTGEVDPMEAAKAAEKAGVKLFCIGVGSQDGVPIPNGEEGFQKDVNGNIVLSKLDEDTLKKIAVLTGGTYVRSIAGDMDLDVIYTKEIRGKMERSTLASGRKQLWEDRFQWFVALAIAACIIELLLPSFKRSIAAVLLLVFLFSPGFSVQADTYRENMQNGLEDYKQEEYQSAIKHFTDAQLENPDKAEVWYNLGNAYYKLGDYDSAQNNYMQALNTEDKTLKEKAYYNLGNASFRKQLIDDAINHYQKALDMDPDDIQARQNLEFAKKMRELQKQQGEKNDRGQKDHSDNKESDSQKEADSKEKSQSETSGNNPEDDQKDASQSSFGNEMDQNQQPSSMQQGADKKPDQQQQTSEPQTAGQTQAENPLNADEKNQAERILNRLEDQPGKAMIPFYRKRIVEKDW